MLIKILGALDILAGLFLWLSIPFSIPGIILGILGVCILLKGIIFIGFGLDILSAMDIIAGIIIIVSATANLPAVLISLISIYLIGKGVISVL